METSKRNSLDSYFKQKQMSFQNREQISKTGPVWGLTPVEVGRL
jgi:hypothetical protein